MEEEKRINNLNKFFSFLSKPAPLNTVLCGYFNRIITSFLNKKQKQILEYVFIKNKEILPLIRKHLYNRSIAETWAKLINY